MIISPPGIGFSAAAATACLHLRQTLAQLLKGCDRDLTAHSRRIAQIKHYYLRS
jgi:hypothetical protein